MRQVFQGNGHQVHVLGFHRREECESAHGDAGEEPCDRQGGVPLEERETVGNGPESADGEKNGQNFAVDVAQSLRLLVHTCSWPRREVRPTIDSMIPT